MKMCRIRDSNINTVGALDVAHCIVIFFLESIGDGGNMSRDIRMQRN